MLEVDLSNPSHYQSRLRELLTFIDSFAKTYGVVHNDIGFHNLIVTPTRIVVIDFGEARVRKKTGTEDGSTDEAEDCRWEERSGIDILGILSSLDRKGLRDRSPTAPRVDIDGGYHGFNQCVRQREDRPGWKGQWFDVLRPEPAVGEEDPGVEKMYELKEEVRVWMEKRGVRSERPPEAYLLPRPGSPDYRTGNVSPLTFASLAN